LRRDAAAYGSISEIDMFTTANQTYHEQQGQFATAPLQVTPKAWRAERECVMNEPASSALGDAMSCVAVPIDRASRQAKDPSFVDSIRARGGLKYRLQHKFDRI
jgi:hypothetical protein